MKQKLVSIIAIAILVVNVLGFGFPGPKDWGLPSGGGWGLSSGGGWGLSSGGSGVFPSLGTLSFGSSANTATSQVTAPSHPLHEHLIVCVGDSITEGLANPNNWPYHLKTRLDGNWTVVNQGVGGAKTADMLARMNATLQLAPHFVIILGGTNDLANGAVPLAGTQENIVAMCTQVESYGAVPVLCTVPPDSNHLEQRDVLNAWIAEYAVVKGYPLIDFYSVIDNPQNPGHSNPTLVMSDGIHPNAAGYVAMGNAIDLDIFTGGG